MLSTEYATRRIKETAQLLDQKQETHLVPPLDHNTPTLSCETMLYVPLNQEASTSWLSLCRIQQVAMRVTLA